MEEEGTIPSNLIKDKHVRWPPGSSALKALKTKAQPLDTWKKFPLLKVKLKSGL